MGNENPMQSRNEFGQYLNDHNLLGIGVEVGVCAGTFSEILLSTWKGRLLVCVDIWGINEPLNKRSHKFHGFFGTEIVRLPKQTQAILKQMQIAGRKREWWDELFKACKTRLARFGDRVTFKRMFSVDAAKTFEDGSLDFVYIDANHSYETVKEDIAAWWPKLKIGGLMSGHDYHDKSEGFPGIDAKRAIDEFAVLKGITVNTTAILPEYISWYFLKEKE